MSLWLNDYPRLNKINIPQAKWSPDHQAGMPNLVFSDRIQATVEAVQRG